MADKGKILAVDDTPSALRLLTAILQEEGYEVRSAINGELALKAALSYQPNLVLLDIRMPEMDGYEVCRRLRLQPGMANVPIVFVSAASETDEKVRGFEIGGVDFVTKPYQRDELMARVRTHLELNRLRNQLENLVDERTAELKESEKKLKTSLLDTVAVLAATVEMRDPYTAGHQRRVSQLAVAIARDLQLSDDQIEAINLAGVVHDVGKIRVPTEILSRPGQLSKLEFDLIREHASNGYEILKNIAFPWPVAQIVLQHHERLDGSGYPQALSGDQILPEARIIAVADVVESMVSHRPYRPALGLDAALDQIARNKGKCFAPEVVDACIKLFRERGFKFTD